MIEVQGFTFEEFCEHAERVAGLDGGALLSRKRDWYTANVRQVCMFVGRNVFKMSYPRLAAFFRRDHSTIHSGVKHINYCRKRGESPFNVSIDEFVFHLSKVLQDRAFRLFREAITEIPFNFSKVDTCVN